MPKFRKKPVVIEAHKYNFFRNDVPVSEETINFFRSAKVQPVEWHLPADSMCHTCGMPDYLHMNVPTLEGWHIMCPNDWLIKGIKGEFYPCKSDIFDATYEVADEEEYKVYLQ